MMTNKIPENVEKFFVYSLAAEGDAKSILDAYAKARGIKQYSDGSCETQDVHIGCDNSPDLGTDQEEIEFMGKNEADARRVCYDFRRFARIKAKPIQGTSEIYAGV